MSGYLTSALAYSVLLALMLTRWRRRLTGSGLAVDEHRSFSISASFESMASEKASTLPLSNGFFRCGLPCWKHLQVLRMSEC